MYKKEKKSKGVLPTFKTYNGHDLWSIDHIKAFFSLKLRWNLLWPLLLPQFVLKHLHAAFALAMYSNPFQVIVKKLLTWLMVTLVILVGDYHIFFLFKWAFTAFQLIVQFFFWKWDIKILRMLLIHVSICRQRMNYYPG